MRVSKYIRLIKLLTREERGYNGVKRRYVRENKLQEVGRVNVRANLFEKEKHC